MNKLVSLIFSLVIVFSSLTTPSYACGCGVMPSLEELTPAFTFGPTVSYSFASRNQPGSWALGFEAGAWQALEYGFIKHDPVLPTGIDFGVEYHFSQGVWRYYGDVQASILLAGASTGLSWDVKNGTAWQTYLWGSFFAGGGVQARYFFEPKNWQLSLNGMAKLPVPLMIFEE